MVFATELYNLVPPVHVVGQDSFTGGTEPFQSRPHFLSVAKSVPASELRLPLRYAHNPLVTPRLFQSI